MVDLPIEIVDLPIKNVNFPWLIDGLPIKNGGSFHGELLVITRW